MSKLCWSEYRGTLGHGEPAFDPTLKIWLVSMSVSNRARYDNSTHHITISEYRHQIVCLWKLVTIFWQYLALLMRTTLVPVVKVHIWGGLLISLGFLLGSATIIVHVCSQLGTIISKWIICAFNVTPRCKPFWHFYNRIPLEPVMYYMEYPHSDLLQLKHNSEHQKDNRFSFKTYLPYL